MNDLKFAFRQLLKNPAFTAVTAVSLALGIGATTALFSVIYGVLVSPYPYKEPAKIWAPSVESIDENGRRGAYKLDDYLEMTRVASFSEVMATSPENVLLAGEFAPESLRGVRVTGNAFQFLGVPPIVGRTVQPSDVQSSGETEPVVMLSYQLWQRLFGGDVNAIGKTLRLNDQLYTIIGVMPPRFGWWTSDGVWLPLAMSHHEDRWFNPIVRLKTGVTKEVAEQDLHRFHLSLAERNPSSFPKAGFKTKLSNYLDVTVASGEMQRTLHLLFGGVVSLLLIGCANVANLQVARATSRAREMAIRLSIGAGRGRLVKQLLTESVLLSFVGGLLGLLFAFGVTRLIVRLMPEFYVPNEARIELNGYVLAFCAVISVLTGILFGLAPALQSSKVDLAGALKDAVKGSNTSADGGRIRKGLVIVEVALSIVLLLSAGLMIRTFVALQHVEVGFNPENVTALGVPLPPKRYATLEQRNRFALELLERVQRLPGVEAAAIGTGGLPFGGPDSSIELRGQPESEARHVTLNLISANYSRTLGIPLKQGRWLTDQEILHGDHLAVINEATSKFWSPGEDPIGKRIRLERLTTPGSPAVLRPEGDNSEATVIGIVGNTRNDGLRNKPQPVVLVPFTLLAPPQRTLAIRSQADPKLLLSLLRAQVRELDNQQPLGRAQTFQEVLGFETLQPRFTMALFSFFAALGLLLAAAGIYSVLSYLVIRRTHEIGVRMALGAQLSDVLGLILSSGGKLVVIGIIVGLLAGFAAVRLLSSQLYQVSAMDPLTYGGVTILLGIVGLLACYIPARRAAQVNPIEALRYE